MSDILDKTRRALVAYVTAGNVGTANIYDAKRSGDKDAPNVGIDTEDEAREDPPGTGNFWVVASVTVKAVAAVDADAVDPKTAADVLTANVVALLELDNDTLMAALSSQIAGFTVMGFGEEKSFEQPVEGDVWKTVWRRMLYCGGF
jgi:hypothetical protein